MRFLNCILIQIFFSLSVQGKDDAIYEGRFECPLHIGRIELPNGQWILENSDVAKGNEKRSIVVLRLRGDRFERLVLIVSQDREGYPLRSYVDSIGDRMSEGIPMELTTERKHDTVRCLAPAYLVAGSKQKENCIGASFVYSTAESQSIWLSHSVVSRIDGYIVTCVHSSPHAISPETVENMYRSLQIR